MVAEGPIGDDSRGSWMVSARQSYLQWLFKHLDLEDTAAFGFTDVHSKLVYDFTGSHQLQFSLVAGRSKLEEENLDPGPNGLAVAHADSSLVTLAWRWTTGTAVIHQRMATLHDGFRNEGFFGQELGRGSGAALVYSADLVRPLTRHAAVRGGAYVERRRDGQTLRQFGRQPDGTAATAVEVRSAGVDWMTSGFGGLTWTPVDPVSVDAGVRIAHASRIESTRASPWIVGAWSISSSLTVRAGVNGAHQFPDSDRISTSPTGELPGPERARHVDLGVEQRIGATWRWHVSAYARGERDVLRQQRAETRLVDGALIERDALPVWRNTLAVSARGLELVVQRRATSGLSGWIGYAYGRARAEDALTGETYWADFDQRHSLNAYGMVRMSTKTSVSTRLRLGSNFPVPGYFTREGLRLFLADRRNEVRLPVYARLDVRASRAFNYRTRRLTLFVELLNLLNRTNYGPADGTVRQSTREAAGYVEKLFPFVPSAGFTIEF
jgi:outer membrane receptor for ferrienterochelin and colicin